uniref:Uncharacterized protein n=1 Tax=Anguilla anguilla TaxID=7936 RepID=A0A0E9QFJ7_ANGAN
MPVFHSPYVHDVSQR